MPRQPGVRSESCRTIVCGSRKSNRWSASATTIADLPSGVKYMLYGSSTGIDAPGLPVRGFIGVTLPSLRPSALFVTHNVRRSHDGTTCCGARPTLKRPTTLKAAGSITYTSCERRLGTYTRGRSSATCGAMSLLSVALKMLRGSRTGGIPGIVATPSAALACGDGDCGGTVSDFRGAQPNPVATRTPTAPTLRTSLGRGDPPCARITERSSATLARSMRCSASDRLHGLGDLHVHAEATQLRGRLPRITAIDADRGARFARSPKLLPAHQPASGPAAAHAAAEGRSRAHV